MMSIWRSARAIDQGNRTDPLRRRRRSVHAAAKTKVDALIQAPTREKLLFVLTVAGFMLPVLAYFAFVHQYSVNVVVADQWSDVSLIGKAFSGHLSFSDLWAQHNENRILFPNLIVLALAYTTHLNLRTETFLSAVLLVGSVALIIWTHRRRSPTTPLLWYCPVAILMLTWAQYENALWGFQIAWYLVMISLVGTLAVLDWEHLSGPSLAAAAAIAVIGSFSSLQGLIIWPAGFLLLLYRRRAWQLLAAWAMVAVATVGVYIYHFDNSPLGYYRINPVLHPLNVVKLFLFPSATLQASRSRSTSFPSRTTITPYWARRALGSSRSG